MIKLSKLPNGTSVYDYTGVRTEFRGPTDVAVYLEEIQGFLGEFLGEQAGVFHEIISDKVHLDILVFPPNEVRNNWTLVTSGMSDLPMNVPGNLHPREDYERAELVFTLPASWFAAGENGMIPENQLADPNKYWPIRLMKSLARMPHDYGSWIWSSHTVASQDGPPEPYAENTKMSGVILLRPPSWPDKRDILRAADGTKVNFFAVVPLHADEMTLKLNKGVEALIIALDTAGVSDVLDAGRPSAVKRKRYLGLF
ncbi:suppressor of fused domain protein [Mesorhizobium sp. B3-1-6]|uniref:suppressor of fused domain protein n=1 Tax=Mesorhizobium sp. B3-1-6 TaxID=2589895 RepID=UPI001128162E|nr:suppressor of fused domain protein [Mesorhizobium sp. B3-1-6]TPI34169.1 suppressor of fused domain protein [Mesorhizobium sp. B3-1-6]